MIKVGQIVKPQGIKGEMKIIPQDKPERYLKLQTLFVEDVEMAVISIVARGGDLYVMLKGVKDRNDAELLRGKEVFAESTQLQELKENEFYFDDLIGAEVLDEDGNSIGKIVDIDQYGAADVISINERNIIFSVPFIDSIFVSVQAGKIIVNKEEYNNKKVSD